MGPVVPCVILSTDSFCEPGNDVAHGEHVLGIFVRDVDPEGFFDEHSQLGEIEGISTEVIDERGFVLDTADVDNQKLCYDLLDAVCDGFGQGVPPFGLVFGNGLFNYYPSKVRGFVKGEDV